MLTLEPHLAKFVGLSELEGGERPGSLADWSFKSNREAFDFATNTLKKLLEEL